MPERRRQSPNAETLVQLEFDIKPRLINGQIKLEFSPDDWQHLVQLPLPLREEAPPKPESKPRKILGVDY